MWFCFELLAPMQRTLRLRCSSERDAQCWVGDFREMTKVADPLAFFYFFAGSRFHVPPEKKTDKKFNTHLPDEIDTCLEPLRRIVVTLKMPPKLFDRLPKLLRDGNTVQLRPIMFSQGINEAQVVADSAAAGAVVKASNEMQDVVNQMGLQLLRAYHEEKLEHFKDYQRSLERKEEDLTNFEEQLLHRQKQESIRCANLMENLEHSVRQASETRKTLFEILILAGDTVRALGGFRMTNCMSGKDRTGMSVTLEQARIAVDRRIHGIRHPQFGVLGINLMKRESNFFLPEGKFKVQVSHVRVVLPKAMRTLGYRKLNISIWVDGVYRQSDSSQCLDWSSWDCMFDVVAPIPATSKIKFAVCEARSMFSQSAALASVETSLERVLRDCDVGSEVVLPMTISGKSAFKKLKTLVKIKFKVLRVHMGRRDAKQIVGGKRVLDIAALMRAHGPRLQNCRKNICKTAYSLRLPARLALPFAYKPPKGTSDANDRPNVLILFADDLGFNDLSCYGHPTASTPHIDALATKGMRFTQWYSGFHVCSPSRGTMMTGRIPPRWGGAGASWAGGVFNADAVGGIPSNETTIAEILSEVGYSTHIVGKWHLGQTEDHLPTSHGFDTYLGIPYSDDMGSSAWQYYNSVDRPPLPLLDISNSSIRIVEQPTNLNLLSERYVNRTRDVIKMSKEKNVPFFLYVAFNHVHVPDFASKAFCNTSLRGRFGDALSELDDAIGKIMRSLEESGVANNTIVFFTSDNGPWLVKGLSGGSAGLLRDGKTTTWEGGVREPGIVVWPGKIASDSISRSVVTTYDIFATIVSIVGAESPPDRIIDGRDISPILFGENDTSPHDCIFHYKGSPGLKCPEEMPENCPGLWAARCGPYKLHYVTSTWTNGSNNGVFHDPPLIFNVEHDPSESWALDTSSREYEDARTRIENAVAIHKRGMKAVPNQMARGVDPNLKVCCDPKSQEKYPQYPNCTCNPENFRMTTGDDDDQDGVFVCAPVYEASDATGRLDSTEWPWMDPMPYQDA
eukprot:g1955.t1